MKDLLPVLEADRARAEAAPHHRRGRRGRGARHARRQQAPRHAQLRRRQGAGLRRSPQGDAQGHRDPHRRPGHRRGARPQARERHASSDLGRAKRVTIDKDNTTIVDGAGDKEEIKGRIEEIRSADREHHQRLRPREAPGAPREARRRRRGRQGRRGHRDRDEGEEGPRRGRAPRDPRGRRRGHRPRRRRRAHPRAVGARRRSRSTDEQQFGVNIIRRAIEEPLRQIAQNAGVEGSIVVNKVREGKGAFGYNAATDKYGDLLAQGVIDPAKVVRTALQNAASVASLMLTTEASSPSARRTRRRPAAAATPATATATSEPPKGVLEGPSDWS